MVRCSSRARSCMRRSCVAAWSSPARAAAAASCSLLPGAAARPPAAGWAGVRRPSRSSRPMTRLACPARAETCSASRASSPSASAASHGCGQPLHEAGWPGSRRYCSRAAPRRSAARRRRHHRRAGARPGRRCRRPGAFPGCFPGARTSGPGPAGDRRRTRREGDAEGIDLPRHVLRPGPGCQGRIQVLSGSQIRVTHGNFLTCHAGQRRAGARAAAARAPSPRSPDRMGILPTVTIRADISAEPRQAARV